MTFADLQAGVKVFLDAIILIFHFQPHPSLGQACTDLMERVELQEILAFTSTHILSEVAHRLMTLDAHSLLGWPMAGIAYRLGKQPAEVQQLRRFRQAIQAVPQLGIQVLPIPAPLIDVAAGISQQTGLLSNDALQVAVMQDQGVTNLASNDDDFDRVPGLTRYAPI